MAIRRDNENLSAVPFPKELRALLDASPVYDMDNVYLSEEGWIYRHYKSANRSRWWDEILFSADVDVNEATNNPVSPTVSAGIKLGSAGYTPTLETGDGTPGFGYGDTILDGGVPAPDKIITSVTIAGEENPTIGDSESYTATVDATATPIEYTWSVSGGNITAGQNTNSATIEWTEVGTKAVGMFVSSSDAEFDGNNKSDTLIVTVANVADQVIGTVTVSGEGNPDDGATETYSVDTSNATASDLTYSWSVDDDGAIVGDADGETVDVLFTHSAGQSTISVTVSSTDPLFDGNNETDGLAVTVAAPAPTTKTVTLNLTGDDSNNAYTAQIDGGAVSNNPAVALNQGDTLIITNNSGGHPVIITESDGGTSTTDGTITGDNPAGDGETLTWDTAGASAGTYYYQCQSHNAMIGTITLSLA